MTEAADPEKTEGEQRENSNRPQRSKRDGLPTIFWVFFIILSIVLTFSITNYTTTGRLPWEWRSNQHTLTNSDLRDFQRTYRLLSSNYYGDVDHHNVVNQGIAGMTEAIDDPYTGFFFDSDNERLQSSINAKFEGVGATVQEKDGHIVVVSPVKDSPAEKAGIKPNDIILSADGRKLENVSTEEAVGYIRGKAGTTVNLSVQRSGETFDVEIERAEVPIETVYSELTDDDPEIAVLQITTFSENTAEEFQHAVETMRQSGAKRFIIDLRGNPGGLLTSALDIANMFLEDGQTIVSVVDKEQNKETYTADNQRYGDFKITEPVAVLVNKGSASASEIIAGALQQSAHIPIIGTQTFGKGTVQSVIPYDKDESRELKLTTGHWITPNGKWINEKGISPDYTVDTSDQDELLLVDTSNTYKEGDESEAVENIKRLFKALGKLDEDEVNQKFDASLTETVKAFQSENNLEVSGEVNPETARALMQEVQKWLQAHDGQKQKAIQVLETTTGGNSNG